MAQPSTDHAYACRLLRERESSRESGDLLARAVLYSLKTGDSSALDNALYAYMDKEAVLDSRFYASMSAKRRFAVALISFLRE